MTIIDPERLRQAIENCQVSQSELARYVGVTPAAIQQLAAGKTRRSVHLSKIANFLNVREGWLTGESDDPQRDGGFVSDFTKHMALIDLDTASSVSLGNFSTISYDTSVLPFDDAIPYDDQKPNASRWAMFFNIGDDMAPTLHHSDRVIVDFQQSTIGNHGAIWLIRVAEELPLMRRLERLSGNRIRLVCDNQRVENREVSLSDLTVEGRIVWQGRTIGDGAI